MRSFLLLLAVSVLGCGPAIVQAPPQTVVSENESIVGWGPFKLGSASSEVATFLVQRGVKLTNSTAQTNPFSVTRFGTALVYPKERDGSQDVLVPMFDAAPSMPEGAFYLALRFGPEKKLASVTLVFREAGQFSPYRYAEDEIVPQLNQRYRRAVGITREGNEIAPKWTDNQGNTILLASWAPGGQELVLLSYSAPGALSSEKLKF
jgi:hypothetical protein